MEFKNPYAKEWREVVKELNSNFEKGLSSSEVTRRLEKYGLNSLQEKKKVSAIAIFLSQFKSPFVILLFIASCLSMYFSEYLDAIAIGIVILINAIIGFGMEYQAEQSMEALKKMTVVPAKVLRDGILHEISAHHVVPGDILFVEAGDLVQADGRLISFSQLEVDESSLTGESVPVSKQLNSLPETTPLAERTNTLYRGTNITKGNGYSVVTATGIQTELGNIATLIQSADAAATPLEKRIEKFSKKLIWITVVLIAFIFLMGILYGHPFVNMLETSIALAVAAIPEGLPIVATLALAQGMLRMAKQNVIVKKLAAVETLGGTSVICTDKTGTLTQNRIEVNLIRVNSEELEFKGDALNQTMGIHRGESVLYTRNYEIIQLASALCNTAEIFTTNGELREVGDPLETGLLKFVMAGKKDIASIRQQYPKVMEEPFDSTLKMMATCHSHSGHFVTYAKGGADEVLLKCAYGLGENGVAPLDDSVRTRHMADANEMASSGSRVIAVAFRESETIPEILTEELIFVGLMGMMDPPRNEVPEAIRDCKSAGVKVIMVTGDHPATAKSIGLKLGLFEPDQDYVMHGNAMGDYEHLDEQKKESWLRTKIFARVSPKQKLDLVKLLQENNHIVGMTGDGVNDAPALKKADIGIAMGLRGTQVAQEVADMILKDDSFSSIVQAIRQGRVIFDNIRRFVIFLLSCNMSELFVIAVVTVLNLHFQLFPLQILYINIVTDVLPALALGVTAGSPSIMKQPPANANQPIIDNKRWAAMIYYSVVITLTTLGAVLIGHYTLHKADPHNSELCNNILFFTLIISQLLHVFNMGSGSTSLFKNEVFTNKYVWYATAVSFGLLFLTYQLAIVRKALDISDMTLEGWTITIGMSFLSLIIIQLSKRFRLVSQ